MVMTMIGSSALTLAEAETDLTFADTQSGNAADSPADTAEPEEYYEPIFERLLRGKGLDVSDRGLVALMSHEDMIVRENAAIVIGQRRLEDGKSALRQALEDSSLSVRVEAARALGKMGEKAGVDTVKEAMAAEGWFELPLIAAGVLVELDNVSGYPVLVQALKDERKHFRFRAVVELPKFDAFTGQEVEGLRIDPKERILNQLSEDPDEFIRINSAYALGRFLKPEDISDLDAKKEGASPKVREAIDLAKEMIRLRAAGEKRISPQEANEG